MTTEERRNEIVEALKMCGLTADVIFTRIRAELDRGNIKEARQQLHFVDELWKDTP